MGRYDNVAFASSGRFAPGVNVAVCQQFTTTAASLTSNVVTLTFSGNPLTSGFVSSATLTVFGFTGADLYLNGSFPIASVSASTISYALVHANGSASSNGTVYQIGSSTQACAPLSTLYTGSTGATTSPNPFTADGLGNYGFWAAPGQYQAQIYGPTVGVNFFFVSMACVPLNSTNCGALLGGNNTWTGNQTFTGQNSATLYNIDGIVLLDGSKYTTCAAANAAAGGVGVIIVTPNYVGANCTPSISQTILDYRQTGNSTVQGTQTNIGFWTFTNATFAQEIFPTTAGGFPLGSGPIPWGSLALGNAANQSTTQTSNATGNRAVVWPDVSGGAVVEVANGTQAMTTALIASGACGLTVTTAAAGVLSTDTINFSQNVAVTAANGGILILSGWPTAGNVNFNYCNPGAGNVTPTAMTINWSVRRP
jgi:hypothetical protein